MYILWDKYCGKVSYFNVYTLWIKSSSILLRLPFWFYIYWAVAIGSFDQEPPLTEEQDILGWTHKPAGRKFYIVQIPQTGECSSGNEMHSLQWMLTPMRICLHSAQPIDQDLGMEMMSVFVPLLVCLLWCLTNHS